MPHSNSSNSPSGEVTDSAIGSLGPREVIGERRRRWLRRAECHSQTWCSDMHSQLWEYQWQVLARGQAVRATGLTVPLAVSELLIFYCLALLNGLTASTVPLELGWLSRTYRPRQNH